MYEYITCSNLRGKREDSRTSSYTHFLLLMFVNFILTTLAPSNESHLRELSFNLFYVYLYVYIYMYISVCIIVMCGYAVKSHVLEIRWTVIRKKKSDHSFIVQHDCCIFASLWFVLEDVLRLVIYIVLYIVLRQNGNYH